jgi:hypothetical protein
VSASEPPPRAAVAPRFSWRRLAYACLPLLVLGGFFAMGWPVCPSKVFFGLPCPGCGLTRATAALLGGDLPGMLALHPLAPILTPLAAFVVGRAILVHAGAVSARFDPLRRVPVAVWSVLGAVLVGVYLARAFGLLGGLPDPIAPREGLLLRGALALLAPLTG